VAGEKSRIESFYINVRRGMALFFLTELYKAFMIDSLRFSSPICLRNLLFYNITLEFLEKIQKIIRYF
jgi:hypothetical protein